MDMQKKGGFSEKRRRNLIFYCCMAFLPMLQYLIFYIGVNFNSILLSFQYYVSDPENGQDSR